jgi:putative ABC transport system ATP-binding protein
LEVRELAVDVGGRSILEGVSFDLRRGERVAVTGASGAGKTTMLRAIAGLHPARGTILLEGKTIAALGAPSFRRSAVYVAQRPALFDDTVQHNLSRPFTYASATKPFPESRARELLERLELPAGAWERNARSLSAGEQQRVALIRALLLDPLLLLLDEPTAALDAENVGSVEALLASAPVQGLLIVTHDAAQADRVAHSRVDLSRFRSAT